MGEKSGLHGHLCCVCCCQVCSSGEGDGVPGPAATAAQLPVATDATVARRPKSCVLPPLLLLNAMGLWAQLLRLEGLNRRHLLYSSLSSISPMCSRPPICRCTEMQNSLAFWYVGQSQLCSVVDVLLVEY